MEQSGASGSRPTGEGPRPPIPAEPPTPRALWPTFMRRTLAEEALRLQAAGPRDETSPKG